MLKRLVALASGSPIPHVITDASAEVIYINDAVHELSGHSLAELEGKHIGNFLKSPNTSDLVIAETREKLNKGLPFQFRTINRHSDGTDYEVGIYIVPFLEGNRSTLHYVAIEKRLEEGQANILSDPDFAAAARALHGILVT